MFKQKTIDCLKLAGLPSGNYEIWRQWYDHICNKYSEKAVYRKLEKLYDKGYVEYGTSVRTSWLTEKGREALKAVI